MDLKEGKVKFIGVVEEARVENSKIRIYPKFCAGLKGIEDYANIIILYWFHLRDDKKNRETLLVFPKRQAAKTETGVFACRSPSRPNPIGMCIVRLLKIDGPVLTVKRLDALQGTPIIDIKPCHSGNELAANEDLPN